MEKKKSPISAYISIIFTLVMVAFLFSSGIYKNYPAYQMTAWQNLSGYFQYFFIFFALVTLLISVHLLGVRKRQLNAGKPPVDKEEEKRKREAYDADKQKKRHWASLVTDFLMEKENRGRYFTGAELIPYLEENEEIASLPGPDKEEWESFMHNSAGWQNGLRFYVQGLIKVIETTSTDAMPKENKQGMRLRHEEIVDGYAYMCDF